MSQFRFRGDEMPTEASRASILEPADAGGGAFEMFLYDPIDSYGGWWGVSAKEFQQALGMVPEDATEIRLYINSPGGEVWDGIAIVNQLRRHPAKVVAIVDGIAASMATIIAVTADELVMGAGSQFMVHDAWNIVLGPEADMLAMAARLSKDSDALAAIYAAKAGGTAAEWRDVMRAETWYTAEETVAAGLADRVATTDPEKVQARAAAMLAGGSPLFRYAGRAEAPAPRLVARATPQAPVSTEPGNTTERESDMSDALKAGLVKRLGITDAELDENGILAALDEALNEQAEDTNAPAAQLPEGAIVVDAAQFEALKEQAAQGAQARAAQIAQSRDALVDAAVADGRVAPANKAAWRKALDDNEAATVPLLAALPTGVAVPVAEVGHALAPDADDAEYRRYYPGANTTKEA